MKRKLFSIIAAIASVLLPTQYAASETVSPPIGYGILAFSSDQPGLSNHLVSFPLEETNTTPLYTSVVGFSQTSTAGAYASDGYYLAASTLSGSKEVPSALIRMDIQKGTWSKVGDLTGFSSLINDMTFDHSTSTMYMVSVLDETVSGLFTVDLKTAATKKIASLDRRFFTLAASWDGQLYGVSFAGEFCKIDKTSGQITVVGPTGFLPTMFQSMEFDHQTKTLWWAATATFISQSGVIQYDECFMAKIDPATGVATKGRSFGDDQLAGLYIPYIVVANGAPQAVQNLKVTPAENGVNSALISWTNPTLTFNGEPIKALTKAEVMRDGQKIGEVTQLSPGGNSQFTDNIESSSGAMHTYTVRAWTTAGEGLPSSADAFVGTDIPASITDLKTTRITSNSMRLTWSPVTTGSHGGWTDVANIRYKVVRNPGNVTVAPSLSDCEWIEENIEEPGSYTYTVTAYNGAGESDPVVSDPIALGPESAFPHTDNFTEEEFEKWTVVDSNNDKTSWQYYNISWAHASGAYIMCSQASADDWLISLPFEFDGDATYKITFSYLSNGTHKMDVNLLNNYNIQNPAIQCGQIEFPKGFQINETTFNFNTSQGGSYNLAFHATTPSGNSYLLIDKIVIEKLVDNNLAATGISGNSKPNEGNTYSYGVSVENRGKNPFSDFKVDLIDQDGNTVGTSAVTEPLASGGAAIYYVNLTVNSSIKSLRGKINSAKDQIEADNLTEPMAITVMPQGTPEDITLGQEKGTTRDIPFNFYGKYSVAQQIYSAKEIGVSKGRIIAISWPYNASTYTNPPTGVGLKVYMANTSQTSSKEWIPQTDLKLVYDGQVEMQQGNHILSLQLGEAFDYSGENLVVVTEHSLENAGAVYYSGVYWPYYTSPISGNAALCYSSDSPITYGAVNGSLSSYGNSVVTLSLQTGGANVSGIVKDAEGKPMEGVTVRIEEIKATTTSDASGTYSFSFVPNGSYTVTANLLGYATDEKKNVVVDDRDVVLDLNISKLPTANISGRVLTPEGKPIGSATVNLTGYLPFSTKTATDGTFSFSNIVCQKSNLVITKDWFTSILKDFDFSTDINLGDLTCGYAHYQVGQPNVETTRSAASITWDTPDKSTLFRYDSGVQTSQYGLTDNLGKAIMGTIFPTPMEIDSICWQTTFEGGPHNTVNLYIFDLDKEGKPTGNLLYSERSIWNTDDEWTVYKPTTPISAPNGCLITLNYPGFLGIGLDDAGREYPFCKNTYYFSTDFDSGEFACLDQTGLTANLMLRASGRVYPAENDPIHNIGETREDLPEWYAYNVWRAAGTEPKTSDWTLLTASPVKSATFTDSGWDTLTPGVYRYAVAPVYPDGSMSSRTVSRFVLRNVYTTLNIEAATNAHSANASGAKVAIVNTDKSEKYEAVIGEDGKARIEGIWKDQYTLTMTLPGYETYTQSLDLSNTDEFTTPKMVLREIIATPVNLNVTQTGDDKFLFTWNESGEITEGFEKGYTMFAAPDNGRIPWTTLDRDGARTYAEADFDFPGRTQAMSYIVFNPKLTTPSMYEQRSASHPHTGNNQLACFASRYGNDDWLMTPRLTYHTPFSISFWAKGYSQTYGETFMVGYSTVSADPATFRWFPDEVEVTKQQWTKYEYTIPAEAVYVVIRATSADGFTLFIDDIQISSGSGMEMNVDITGPEVSYEVSLDGNPVKMTDTQSHLFENVAGGTHTASVKAVYASGKSENASIVFGQGGIGDVMSESLAIYPNPAHGFTNVSGRFTGARLYALSGSLLRTYRGDSPQLDLSGINSGLYLLEVATPFGSRTFRLVVK